MMRMRWNGLFRTVASLLGATCLLAGSVSAAPERTGGERFTTGSSDPIIDYIDERIRTVWEENEVKPSPHADDAEWLRRVYLDIVGHIPSGDELDAFLADEDPGKRSRVIEELIEHPDYVRNFTTIWTNLSLGRVTPDRTSRPGMEKFFRESFARNRPWNEIVYDLMTAEGHYEENGAVNFLLGQLMGNPNRDDYAVEATAGPPACCWACRSSARSVTTTRSTAGNRISSGSSTASCGRSVGSTMTSTIRNRVRWSTTIPSWCSVTSRVRSTSRPAVV